MDELEYDNASCADTGSDEIDIRRTNKYICTGSVQLESLAGNTSRVFAGIRKSGTVTVIATLEFSGLSGGYPDPLPVTTAILTVGESYELIVFHNSGSTEATYVGNSPTHLEITEVLT